MATRAGGLFGTVTDYNTVPPVHHITVPGSLYAGGSRDVNPPVISLVTPASGSQLASRHTRISFRVSDLIPGANSVNPANIFIWLKYQRMLEHWLLYDGSEFLDPFKESTVTPSGQTILDFSLMQAGGWIDQIEKIRIRVIDGHGNIDVEI